MGCNKSGQETGQARGTTDNLVTTRQTQDTTLVIHDTTVKVGTTSSGETSPPRVDTTQKSTRATGATAPTDTAR